jgi:hypothetical protein
VWCAKNQGLSRTPHNGISIRLGAEGGEVGLALAVLTERKNMCVMLIAFIARPGIQMLASPIESILAKKRTATGWEGG